MQPVRQHENSFEVVEGLDFKWSGGRSRSAKTKYRFRDELYRIEALPTPNRESRSRILTILNDERTAQD